MKVWIALVIVLMFSFLLSVFFLACDDADDENDNEKKDSGNDDDDDDDNDDDNDNDDSTADKCDEAWTFLYNTCNTPYYDAYGEMKLEDVILACEQGDTIMQCIITECYEIYKPACSEIEDCIGMECI